jgi:membrane associated rhomboid family serine protease
VTPVVRFLLFANVAVFFAQSAFPYIGMYGAFYPRLFLYQPWTIVTYMFLHGGLMHLLFNMLSLFFFGPRVEQVMGSRRFTTMYFIAGISGALLSFALSPRNPIVGASAGVFGVMLAFAHYWPDQIIMIWGIIPVPARLLVILTTIMAFWMGFGGARDGIAHFAHLGGYAGAWVYLLIMDRSRKAFRKKATAPVPAVAEKVDTGAWKSIDTSKIHSVNREEVNRILDKINAQGIGSLTPEERLFLSNFVPPDDKPSQVH